MRVGSSAASTIASTPRPLASRPMPSPAPPARTVAVATPTPPYSSPPPLPRRLARPAGAHGRRGDLDALVLLPHRLGAPQRLARALEVLVRDPRVERQRHRDLEHPHRLDDRAALALVGVLLHREPAGRLHDVVV